MTRKTIACIALVISLAGSGVGGAQTTETSSGTRVSVNGIDLSYRVVGSGPPLMLLHGYGWSGEEWDRFIPQLSQQFQLIIPDMRGHGRSSTPATGFLQRDVAADILALADSLRLPRFAAVGHSGGANALFLAAAQQPERIASLVVIGAQHEFTESNRRAMRSYPEFERLPEVVQTAMSRVHARGRPQIDWLLAQFRAMGSNRDDLNLTLARLGQIRARVLIIVGDDEPLDLALAEKRAIPNAKLWVIPGQGHFPFWVEFGGSRLAENIFPMVLQEFLLSAEIP